MKILVLLVVLLGFSEVNSICVLIGLVWFYELCWVEKKLFWYFVGKDLLV